MGFSRYDGSTGTYSSFLILIGCTTPLSSSILHNIVPSPFTWNNPLNSLNIFLLTGVVVLMKYLDRLEMELDEWLSMSTVKESDSTAKF